MPGHYHQNPDKTRTSKTQKKNTSTPHETSSHKIPFLSTLSPLSEADFKCTTSLPPCQPYFAQKTCHFAQPDIPENLNKKTLPKPHMARPTLTTTRKKHHLKKQGLCHTNIGPDYVQLVILNFRKPTIPVETGAPQASCLQ